jgi:hypothetical protein
MILNCPRCKGAITFDPALAGQQVSCPHCQGLLQMPVIKTTVAPAAVIQPEPESSMDFTSAEPSPSSRRREAKQPKKKINPLILVGCGIPAGLVLMTFAAILIDAVFVRDGKKGDKVDERSQIAVAPVNTPPQPAPMSQPPQTSVASVLTADYLPHKVGTTAYYKIEVIAPKGPPNMVTSNTWTFEDGGILKSKTDTIYSRTNGVDTRIKGGWELRDIPVKSSIRRVSNGFLEEKKEQATERLLKIGAKPGDSWDADLGNGITQRSTLVELVTRPFDYDGKDWQRAKVATTQSVRSRPEETLSWESTYVKNVGLVEKRVTDHTGKEVSVWKLSVARHFAELTDAERRFFEGK